MLCVQRVLISLLQMHKSAGRLDQSFKKIGVTRIGFQPELFQDVMRFVIALFIPAMKKGAVKRLVCDVFLVQMAFVASQVGYKLRNPLAFVHGELNLVAAQIMSKPPTDQRFRGNTLTRPLSLARERRPSGVPATPQK